MRPTKSRITAAQFMDQLQSDPNWVRQNKDRESRHDARTAQLQAELVPEQKALLTELANAGYDVGSVWDLVNTKSEYSSAIPILANYLLSVRHPVLREGIARALTVPEALEVAGRIILEELKAQKDPPSSNARWALANALTVAADASMIDELHMILMDDGYADVKERIGAALKNLRAK